MAAMPSPVPVGTSKTIGYFFQYKRVGDDTQYYYASGTNLYTLKDQLEIRRTDMIKMESVFHSVGPVTVYVV